MTQKLFVYSVRRSTAACRRNNQSRRHVKTLTKRMGIEAQRLWRSVKHEEVYLRAYASAAM